MPDLELPKFKILHTLNTDLCGVERIRGEVTFKAEDVNTGNEVYHYKCINPNRLKLPGCQKCPLGNQQNRSPFSAISNNSDLEIIG